jgi:hypothetical protein
MKVKFTVALGLVGCKQSEVVDIPEDDVEGLSEDGLQDYLQEYALDWQTNYVDVYWSVQD